MSQVELAKRYAKALLHLGHQKEKAKDYQSQIRSVANVVSSPDVTAFFLNTAVAQDNKKKTLEQLFSGVEFDEDVKAFLFLLVENGRLTVLPEIVKASQELLDADDGITRGKIKSMAPLSDSVKADYENKIGQILKKKIYLEQALDEKILGGVRVEIGGWTFDDSLETHLNQLGETLLHKN